MEDPDDFYCPQAALIDKETADRVERRLAKYRAKIKAQQAAIKQHEIRMKQHHQLQQQQQHRMIWMGSGAMLLMAVSCWMWYKKSNGHHQRRDDSSSSSSRSGQQLFLNKDDKDTIEFNGTPEELQYLFNEASKAARNLRMLDQRDQLMMYGLYKQALLGDVDANNSNSTAPPSKLNVVTRAKYDAWKKFTGLPKEFAMQKYCEVVYHFVNGGVSSFGENEDDDNNADVVYPDDEDVDEDGCPIHQDDDDIDDSLDLGMMGIRQSTLSNVLPSNKLQSNEELGSSPEIRLRNAALSSDKVALEQAIQEGANLNDADESGQTALHFSADKGCIDCMRLLLNAGANVNATDQDGISVLQTAVVAGIDVEGVVRMLLEGGADPDAKDDDGDSPRSTALEEDRPDLADLFALYPSR